MIPVPLFGLSHPRPTHLLITFSFCLFCTVGWAATAADLATHNPRLRLIIMTDAGGDPDDEQSLVRLLVYANEFDLEGIIANRPLARDRENKNPVRDGLGIVRALVQAYGQCHANLVRHDARYPLICALLLLAPPSA